MGALVFRPGGNDSHLKGDFVMPLPLPLPFGDLVMLFGALEDLVFRDFRLTHWEGIEEGLEEGISDGCALTEGVEEGISDGCTLTEGVEEGISEGICDGISEGIALTEGIEEGISDGCTLTEGVEEGIFDGCALAEGVEEGISDGCTLREGVKEGCSDGTTNTFHSMAVSIVPSSLASYSKRHVSPSTKPAASRESYVLSDIVVPVNPAEHVSPPVSQMLGNVKRNPVPESSPTERVAGVSSPELICRLPSTTWQDLSRVPRSSSKKKPLSRMGTGPQTSLHPTKGKQTCVHACLVPVTCLIPKLERPPTMVFLN